MKFKIKIILVLIVYFILSCDSPPYEKNINESYQLSTINGMENMTLFVNDNGAYVGVVGPTIFAIGYNEDFIILKQHPTENGSYPNKSITAYYIIPLKEKVNDYIVDNKIGPLSKEEFLTKRNKLGVPNYLKFTKTFEELK